MASKQTSEPNTSSPTKQDLIDLTTLEFSIWLDLYNVKNEKGDSLDWRDHLFLFDIADDWSPEQIVLKAAQLGFSTLMIIKTLWAAKYKKFEVIYTLPTMDAMYGFVRSKVNRIIENNPELQKYIKTSDTLEQKQVGDNMVNYQGTNTLADTLITTSDLNVNDELDASDQQNIEKLDSRLQQSKYKGKWQFTNPRNMGAAGSSAWEKSDKKEWFIVCPECGEEQFLRWPESIDKVRGCYQCLGCDAEIVRETRRVGVWKATADGKWSGYHMSLMMAPWVTAKEIIGYFNTKGHEYFWGSVLGLPYAVDGSSISDDIFTRNMTLAVNSQKGTVIGCDSGVKKHYVMGNSEGLYYYGVTEKWKTIEDYLRNDSTAVLIVDGAPDITGPRELREKFPGRVFLNHYARDKKNFNLIKWGEKKDFGSVASDRNPMIQLVIDEFITRRIPLQGNLMDWEDYIKHWRTLYKVNGKDSRSNDIFQWLSSNSMDHWAHATVLWRIGMEKYGQKGQASFIQSGEGTTELRPSPSLIFGKTHAPSPVFPDEEDNLDE